MRHHNIAGVELDIGEKPFVSADQSAANQRRSEPHVVKVRMGVRWFNGVHACKLSVSGPLD